MSDLPSKNTDVELWRQDLHDPLDPGNAYAPKVFVDKRDRIGMEAGGHVMVEPVERWMEALEFYYRATQSIKV